MNHKSTWSQAVRQYNPRGTSQNNVCVQDIISGGSIANVHSKGADRNGVSEATPASRIIYKSDQNSQSALKRGGKSCAGVKRNSKGAIESAETSLDFGLGLQLPSLYLKFDSAAPEEPKQPVSMLGVPRRRARKHGSQAHQEQSEGLLSRALLSKNLVEEVQEEQHGAYGRVAYVGDTLVNTFEAQREPQSEFEKGGGMSSALLPEEDMETPDDTARSGILNYFVQLQQPPKPPGFMPKLQTSYLNAEVLEELEPVPDTREERAKAKKEGQNRGRAEAKRQIASIKLQAEEEALTSARISGDNRDSYTDLYSAR